MTTSRELLRTVARRLVQLNPPVVFVGGVTTHFFVTDPGAPIPTSTKDVDVIIPVSSRVAYYTKVVDELKALGAREDSRPDAPTCRWILEGVVVDVMPTDPSILADAVRTAVPVRLDDTLEINCVSAPYFVATKAEAYLSRGRGDLLASKDIEDIVAVLDGRPQLADEIDAAPEDVRQFVAAQCAVWLVDRDFSYSVEGYLQGDDGRSTIVLDRLARIAAGSRTSG